MKHYAAGVNKIRRDSPAKRSMTVAVVAEKPSVARDLARALGAKKRGDGFLYGNGYAVTWRSGTW